MPCMPGLKGSVGNQRNVSSVGQKRQKSLIGQIKVGSIKEI